jgi:excisionase family DNA binding protein
MWIISMTKAKRQSPPFHLKPIAIGIDAAGVALDCGRTKVYDLINKGCLEAFKIGSSTKITLASIDAYVAGRLKEGFCKARYPRRTAA